MKEFPEDITCTNDINDSRQDRINALWKKLVDGGKKPAFIDILPGFVPRAETIKFAKGYHYTCLRVKLVYNNCRVIVQILSKNA